MIDEEIEKVVVKDVQRYDLMDFEFLEPCRQ